MARTKAEVRAFLDSLVGSIVVNKGNSDYNGQCVTLTKALLEFLGIPNPYAARGDAKDAGDTYIRQGIGSAGRGWLTIVVNRDMGLIGGVRYGHIWIDLQGEANYESNGARALYTTKNTRPLSQGQQFINLDRWITEGDDMITKNDTAPVRVLMSEVEGWGMEQVHSGSVDSQIMGAWVGKSWVEMIMHGWTVQKTHRGHLLNQINTLNAQIAELSKRPTPADVQALKDAAKAAQDEADAAERVAAEAKKTTEELIAQRQADMEAGDSFMRRLGQFISKYLPGGK